MRSRSNLKVDLGVLGTYLGGSVIGSCHLKPIFHGEIQMWESQYVYRKRMIKYLLPPPHIGLLNLSFPIHHLKPLYKTLRPEQAKNLKCLICSLNPVNSLSGAWIFAIPAKFIPSPKKQESRMCSRRRFTDSV